MIHLSRFAPILLCQLALKGGRRRAMNTGIRPLSGQRGLSLFGLHFLAPGDFAAIYNTRPLYARGLDGTGSYWSFWTGKGGVSAKGYIPEVAWNESGSALLGLGSPASGGGPSSVHAKPAWQKGLGVPADGHRDLPDVSLASDMANGYLIETGGLPSLVGGTSCAAPAFAGIMALVVQHTGQRQGNPNPALYRMAAAQFSAGGPQVFHDILLGNNSVPGTKGYACGPGYDLATGLGSVDAQALVEAWGDQRQ